MSGAWSALVALTRALMVLASAGRSSCWFLSITTTCSIRAELLLLDAVLFEDVGEPLPAPKAAGEATTIVAMAALLAPASATQRRLAARERRRRVDRCGDAKPRM